MSSCPAATRRRPQPPRWALACRCLAAVGLLAAPGCHSIGPKTIPNDRFDYSSALAESWKSMMLLNIVKTRYLDLPIFLDVGQVVSGYSLQTGVSVNGQIARTGAGDTFLGIGGQGTFTQNPTITYTPQTGDQFLKAVMEPVAPARIFSLVQSGYAADFVLQLGLESLNGLRNQPMSLASRAQADPEFFTVLRLLREIQDFRAVGLKVERPTNGTPATVMFFRSESASAEIQEKIQEARRLLGLAPDETSLRLVQSPLRGGPGELAVESRSIWQIIGALSLGVQVPPAHTERRLTPPLPPALNDDAFLMRVQSGTERPDHSFVAVPYEGAWFWIADDDWKSKRAFTSILFLFTLSDGGSVQSLPALTIPTR